MQVVMFYHSLLSDWNHGNAHFLRGVASELQRRGHRVVVYEPRNGWSLSNLRRDHGEGVLAEFRRAYPGLESRFYDPHTLDLDRALDQADLVMVHEWNDRQLVARIGQHRRNGGDYVLLFHDTHHRGVSEPEAMAAYDLRYYDGVMAFGETLREVYLRAGWSSRVYVWHEAADTWIFRPMPGAARDGDLVWVGNWGDDERSAELQEFLLDPVRDLALQASVHGVRYPERGLQALRAAGIDYRGFLPNYLAPEVFARYRVTVHVPRRPYVEALRGIPTIRVFEALACGIPLVSAPWEDSEGLFTPGQDFLLARDGEQMRGHLRDLLNDDDYADELARRGLETIRARHTCAHRVDELLGIHHELSRSPVGEASSGSTLA